MSTAGRPRRYQLEPATGIADPDAAKRLAWIEELTARLLHMIEDLSPEAINFVPEGGSNSIGLLVLHMCAGELHWLRRLGGEIEADMAWICEQGMQDPSGDVPERSLTAGDLLQAVGITRPWSRRVVAGVSDPQALVSHGDMSLNLAGVLDHVAWHWTYHSGQVGLLRRLSGPRYQWRFDSRLTAD